MRVAHYRENDWDILDDNMTVAQIKESLVEVFPELQTATAREVGNDIFFEAKAGIKG